MTTVLNHVMVSGGTHRLEDRETLGNRKLVKSWHTHIIAECEQRLRRELSDAENSFITSRGGFIALEMIEDTVKSLEGDDLVEYLNSEDSDA